MAGGVGDAFLNAFIQKLVDTVTSPDLWKDALEGKVDSNELKKWGRMSQAIRAVLHDAEEKQMTDKAVKMWLDDLRDFAYDLDDILGEIATEDSTSRIITTQPRSSILSSLLHFIRNVFASGSGSKFKEMTGRLQDIVNRKKVLNLLEIDAGLSGRKRKRAAEVQSTTSLVVESRVYGREADKVAIVNWLLEDDKAGGELSVIAIVGMAGIGKTTLAQLAFNDDQVSAHFDFSVWVCVSGDLDLFTITKTILQSVDPDSCDFNDLNNLQVKLKQKLTGKKFLLVLDNVWDKNSVSWDTLCKPMRVGAPGSKIIVTTRDEGVAAVGQTCPVGQLSEDDCMAIFTQQALGRTNFEAHPELEAVGKKIVRRCRGLPLAATVLGGMLRNQTGQDEWASILQSKIWDLPEEQNDILPALRLSYLQLPSHLKPCFAYCSIFPKDYEFDKDELVLLWMAEGFLLPQQGKSMLKEGSKYFDDLLSRSFFQRAWRSSRFVMHDLMHDLSQFVAGEIYFHLDSAGENNESSSINFAKGRHSSFIRQNFELKSQFEPFIKGNRLRTLVALPINRRPGDTNISVEVFDDLLKEVKYLRVLSLSGYQMSEFPDSIAKLKHLRYLNLSHSPMRMLPDSIGCLYNLRSLILSNCIELTMLPMEIGNLVELRHLDISDTLRLNKMPCQIGSLTNLQMLSKFIVGQGSGLGIRELKNMPHLQGKLEIFRLHNVLNAGDARDANLESKNQIEELEMNWSSIFGASRNGMNEVDVLEELKPHENLKKLLIGSYGGSRFPSWMSKSFPTMTHLTIFSCSRCTSLPALGQLSSLKVLHIIGMDEVKSIGKEFYGGIKKPFASLESLKFSSMPKWVDWDCPDAVVEEVELFPSLRQLAIWNANVHKLLNGLHTLTCLEELELDNCPNIESFPDTGLPSKLRRLKVSYCAALKLLPHNYSSSALRSLVIRNCRSLRCFPRGELPTTLKRLIIEACPCLESLPEEMMHHSSSSCLESLEIRGCSSLHSFPGGELPSTLKGLKIEGLSLSQLLILNNTALDYLELANCPNLETLPECLDGPKRLSIRNCPRLEYFPEAGLGPNLTSLEIEDCQNLKSLPHEMRNLQSLKISNCRSLKFLPKAGWSPT